MYTFKKKLITHACALSFLAASVGSGFGAWIFTNKSSSNDLNPTVVETDAVVLSEYLTPSFVSKNLIIEDTGEELTGIEIRLKATFNHIQGSETNKHNFAIIYSTSIAISGNDSNKSNLGEYISLSSVYELPTVADKDTDAVISPLSCDGTEADLIKSTPGTGTNVYNITHPFTSNDTGTYNLDVCVFPRFDYDDSKKPTSISDYSALKAAIKNTKFVFTFSMIDVAVLN